MTGPKVYGITVMRPPGVTPESVGIESHVRQVRAIAQARSAAHFARRLIAAGLESGSEAAVAARVRGRISTTGNLTEIEVAAGGGLYVTGMNRPGGPYVKLEEKAS